MISLESVSKRYGSKPIIHDISFDVGKGEIVGFLGPNGAGKTTTMRMIAGFTTPTSGRITVAGYDMASQNLDAARKLGYLPEHPPLYDVLDVSTYLRFVAKVKGVPRAAIAADIDRVISACKLEEVVKREIYKLSKGYRQRVGLAQALLGKPEVLLLDEPTAGLDPGQIQETREVIRSFGKEHAVLISTHILPEVTLICQRVAIIYHGRLMAIDGVIATQVGKVPGRESLCRAECQVEARMDIESDIARVIAGRWALHRLDRQQPTLENVFLRYVSEAVNKEVAA